jgi:hypothetical protein
MMLVVVTDSGVRRKGGTGKDGYGDNCEQEIAENFHATGSFANRITQRAAIRNCLQHTSRVAAEK